MSDPYWDKIGKEVEQRRNNRIRRELGRYGPTGGFVESGGHQGGQLVGRPKGVTERYRCDSCGNIQLERKLARHRKQRTRCASCGAIVYPMKEQRHKRAKPIRCQKCKTAIPAGSSLPVCAPCFNKAPLRERNRMMGLEP